MNYHAPNLPKDKHCFFDRHSNIMATPPANVARVNQCQHTNNAIFVDRPQIKETYADGMVTNNPEILLVISTADCTPILFADYKKGLVAAVHAGWKGALKGIIENSLDLMQKYGSSKENITAAIGPHFKKQNFDAKQDMHDMFTEKDKNFAKYFTPKDNNYLFDMTAFVLEKLQNYGIKDISMSDIDTYSDPNYNSYRLSCHQGSPNLKDLNYSTIRL